MKRKNNYELEIIIIFLFTYNAPVPVRKNELQAQYCNIANVAYLD